MSQPGKPKGRGNKAVPVPTPVEQLARQHLPETAILCPKSAREVCHCAGATVDTASCWCSVGVKQVKKWQRSDVMRGFKA